MEGERALRTFLHHQGDEFAHADIAIAPWFGADPRYRRGVGLGYGSVWFSEPKTSSPNAVVPVPTHLIPKRHMVGEISSVFVSHVKDAARFNKRIEHEVMLPLIMTLGPLMQVLKEDSIIEGVEGAWNVFKYNWRVGSFSRRISRVIKSIDMEDWSGEFASKLDEFGDRLGLADDNSELQRLLRFSRIMDTQINSMRTNLHRLMQVMASADKNSTNHEDDLMQRVEKLNSVRTAALDMSNLLRQWYAMHLELSSWSHRLELSTWMGKFEVEGIDPLLKMLSEEGGAEIKRDMVDRFDEAEEAVKRFRHDWSMGYDSVRELVPEDVRGFVINASHYVKGLVGIVLPKPGVMKVALEKIMQGGDGASSESLFKVLTDQWKRVRVRFMDNMNERPALEEIEHLFGTFDFGDVEVIVRGKDKIPEHVNDGVLFMTLYHLVSNALEYQREGKPLAVLVSAKREEGMTRMVVRDNGKGMSEERLAQVKAGMGVNSINPRRGQGISTVINQLVPRMVRGHVGLARMDIWSDLREGTTFTIRIPDPPSSVTSLARTVRVLR
jgi:signal transduction histidine kinase